MKKRASLIIVALLITASLANAGIFWAVDPLSPGPGGTFNLAVGWDGLGAGDWLGYVDVFGGTINSVSFGPHAGDFPASFEGPYATTDLLGQVGVGQEVKLTQAWSVGAAPQTGTAFTLNVTWGTGNIRMQLWDDALGYDAPASVIMGYLDYSYAISGYVRDAADQPVSGVTMLGLPDNVITDSLGHYSAMVFEGWGGTVTPSKAGYNFSPESRSYHYMFGDLADQNYTIPEPATLLLLGLGGMLVRRR